MSKFDEFMEFLEAALGDPETREAFIQYVHELTPQEQAEILAEAEQRDPKGSLEWSQILDLAEDEDGDVQDLSGGELN